jgi:hypothetical protein
MAVRAGHRSELTFVLSPAATHLLVKNHWFCTARVRLVARRSHHDAVADRDSFELRPWRPCVQQVLLRTVLICQGRNPQRPLFDND